MNINSISRSIRPMSRGLNIKRRIFDLIPNMLVKDRPMFDNIGNFINRPDVNRGIMGITALLTQPYIDLHNPDVDEETAQTSMCRTIGKIVAGTTVGCLVRSGCYYLIKGCTSTDPKASKWKKLLMPSRSVQQVLASKNQDWFKSYKNVLSTMMALVIMLGTNFLFDVPLTTKISNKLNEMRKARQKEQEGKVKQ